MDEKIKLPVATMERVMEEVARSNAAAVTVEVVTNA
jgi:hypothetical protein